MLAKKRVHSAIGKFPATGMLVATQSFSLCGYLGDKHHAYHLQSSQILLSQETLSNSLNRIVLHEHVPFIEAKRLTKQDYENVESSTEIEKSLEKTMKFLHF